MSFPRIVCIGEALTDMHQVATDQWHSCVGGSTWNVARACAKLGLSSAFAGGISRDLLGQALWRASEEAQLDLRFLQTYDKSPLLAMVEQGSTPQYFFIGDDSADLYFDPAALPTGWQQSLQWAHFGGISLARQPLAQRLVELAVDLKARGVKISYDPNFRNLMGAQYDATLARMCELADLIKVSDEDCRGLMRCDDTDAAFAKLRQGNPQTYYFLTKGAAGASLYVGERSWHTTAPDITVVDSVGAGDASVAGLLYSFMQDACDYPAHLQFAVAAGSAACLVAGAHAPTLQEIETIKFTMPAMGKMQ